MDSRVLAGLVFLAAIGAADAQTVAALSPADPAQASYDSAFGLTRTRNFDQAQVAWESFLRQYPDHPLDGNAQYFLGETYYGRNDFRRAAAAYALGAEKYPKGELAAETILKLGISLGRSDQADAACDAFARLERGFPNITGVVRERTLVEKHQYHCSTAIAATPASLPGMPPGAAAEPAVLLPPAAPPQVPMPRADADPAPPAQPVTPVERQALGATEAERAAARAELYVTPPPVVGERAGRSARARSGAPTEDTVKTAQTLLAALNYDAGPVDGQVGPKLHDAVREFEKKSGLHPDGEVSDHLLQRLSAALVGRKGGEAAKPASAPAAAQAGTGFIVSRSGFVITSYRLVSSCAEIRARPPGAADVAVPLVASDAGDDLALLRLTSPAATAIMFHDGRGPRQGDGVVVTGLATGDGGASDFYLTTGVVSGLSGARNDNDVLRVSTPLGAERGGAPVFDRAGQLVGILAAGPPARAKSGDAPRAGGLALRATIARNFLDANSVDYDSSAAVEALKAVDIGDRAKSVVVRVECRR